MNEYIQQMTQKAKNVVKPEGEVFQVLKEIASNGADQQEAVELAYAFGKVIGEDSTSNSAYDRAGECLMHYESIDKIISRSQWSLDDLDNALIGKNSIDKPTVLQEVHTLTLYMQHIRFLIDELRRQQREITEDFEQKNTHLRQQESNLPAR